MSVENYLWQTTESRLIELTAEKICLFYSSAENDVGAVLNAANNLPVKICQTAWAARQVWMIYTLENITLHLPVDGKYCLQSIYPLCELLAFFDESNSQLPELQLPDINYSEQPCGEEALKSWFTLTFLLNRSDKEFLQLCQFIRKQEAYWLVRYLLPYRCTSEKVLCLSQNYGFSYSYFRRLASHCLGTSAKKKLLSWRISQTVLDIIDRPDRITDIALQNGFASSSHVSTLVKQKLAIKPLSIRKRNKTAK